MAVGDERKTYISVSMAIQQTGLSGEQVQRIVARQLVAEPLDETDLVELRRIRRLRELGVNMSGIEIILRMRRRIQTLRAELGARQRLQQREHRSTRIEE
jgi:hypothetical protein